MERGVSPRRVAREERRCVSGEVVSHPERSLKEWGMVTATSHPPVNRPHCPLVSLNVYDIHLVTMFSRPSFPPRRGEALVVSP